MDLDMEKYVMRCAECGTPLTMPEVLVGPPVAQGQKLAVET